MIETPLFFRRQPERGLRLRRDLAARSANPRLSTLLVPTDTRSDPLRRLIAALPALGILHLQVRSPLHVRIAASRVKSLLPCIDSLLPCIDALLRCIDAAITQLRLLAGRGGTQDQCCHQDRAS
jgi:hypothetical protein